MITIQNASSDRILTVPIYPHVFFCQAFFYFGAIYKRLYQRYMDWHKTVFIYLLIDNCYIVFSVLGVKSLPLTKGVRTQNTVDSWKYGTRYKVQGSRLAHCMTWQDGPFQCN